MLERSKYSMRNITNDKVTEYIDQRFQPVNQELWRLRLDAEDKYIPIIQRDVESFMVTLINIIKPKRILEIGTAIGYSSMVMALTAKKAHISTIEKSDLMVEKAIDNIQKMKLTNQIEVIPGDAREKLLQLKENIINGDDKFDMVFIDGAKSHYVEFCNIIMDMVRPGGIILCDNILMRGMTVDDFYDTHDKHRTSIKKMREFIEYITGVKRVQTSLLPIGDGVSVSYMKE